MVSRSTASCRIKMRRLLARFSVPESSSLTRFSAGGVAIGQPAFAVRRAYTRGRCYFSIYCGVDHRQDTRCRAIRVTVFSRRHTVSDSNDLRRHELECLRLASDCMQLAGEIPNPALQSHFVRMARVWQILAEQGPSADIQTEHSTKWSSTAHAPRWRRSALPH